MAAPLTLHDLGEEAVVRGLVDLLPASGQLVLTGPGDDCAVVRLLDAKDVQLLKVDSVVEGVHFNSEEDMLRVGWKALCRAISDVAAMGGTPVHALITLAVQPSVPWSRVRLFYEGILKAASVYEVSIVGGETGKTSGPFVCSVFLTGKVSANDCVLRAGGRPGDVLFVTGRLGGSLASGRHLDFCPRLREGQWLASRRFPSAMMDVSDGLGVDVQRLARASKCGVELYPESIPCHNGCTIQQALSDGEDFELLLAVPPERVEALCGAWKEAFPGVPLSRVGNLTELERGCTPHEIFIKGGYDHFQ